MKLWSKRKALACAFSACAGAGSVLSCGNSTRKLQNWLFLPLLCQTWLPVRSLPALSPAEGLLWWDQINQKSPGTPALSRAVFPPGPPAAPASPAAVDMTSGVSSISPLGRFHNGLEFRLRKGLLVCCHCWLLFSSTPTTSVQHPSCPWNIFLF